MFAAFGLTNINVAGVAFGVERAKAFVRVKVGSWVWRFGFVITMATRSNDDEAPYTAVATHVV